MIIQCESCSRKFVVKDIDIPKEGRMVQCGYCSVSWHQLPSSTPTKNIKQNVLSFKEIVLTNLKSILDMPKQNIIEPIYISNNKILN